jgi:hypothetical protein
LIVHGKTVKYYPITEHCKRITTLHDAKNAQCTDIFSLFVWLVADGWCWFVLREKYCWLVAGGWFVLRGKYCWLVADKPSEQGAVNI